MVKKKMHDSNIPPQRHPSRCALYHQKRTFTAPIVQISFLSMCGWLWKTCDYHYKSIFPVDKGEE